MTNNNKGGVTDWLKLILITETSLSR